VIVCGVCIPVRVICSKQIEGTQLGVVAQDVHDDCSTKLCTFSELCRTCPFGTSIFDGRSIVI